MNDRHLANIHLLSRRFTGLQGLRVAFAGAIVALVLGGYLLAVRPTTSGALAALLVALALAIPGEVWLHRYYAGTFGRQVARPAPPWTIKMLVLGCVGLGMFLNSRFPEIPAGGPTAATVVFVSVVLAVRDWPWRAHYLGVAGVVAAAFASMVSGGGAADPGLTLATTLLVTGLALVPAGLLDHWWLVRLLGPAEPTSG